MLYPNKTNIITIKTRNFIRMEIQDTFYWVCIHYKFTYKTGDFKEVS